MRYWRLFEEEIWAEGAIIRKKKIVKSSETWTPVTIENSLVIENSD
jgi:hypothetical protein